MNAKASDKPCRACGGLIVRRLPDNALECGSCGSVMVASVPSPAELAAYYNDYNSRYRGGGGSGGRNQERYAIEYLRRVIRHSPKGALLDVGCGNNPFPNRAASSGFDTTAMDLSRPPALDSRVKFVSGGLSTSDLLGFDEVFDVVTAWAVLEHTPDPDLAICILSSLLAAGGQLHITIPECGTWLTTSAAARTAWYYPPEHLHLLSPRAIALLASRYGLRIIETSRFELTFPRWCARFGIGLAEAVLGSGVRAAAPTVWERYRYYRQSRFFGILYFRMTQA